MRIRFALAVPLFLTGLLAAAGPASMPDLLKKLGDDDPAVRGTAFDELAQRYEEWTAQDLALLEGAARDADVERAAGARQAREQVKRLRRIGPQLAEAWTTIGSPEGAQNEDKTTASLLEMAANCWKGGSASDREVREFVAMIREAGGDPVESCPFQAIGRAQCRPLAAELAARLTARIDGIDAGRADLIIALGETGDPKYGPLLEGYIFGPAKLQAACLQAARRLHATGTASSIALLSEDQRPGIRQLAVETLGFCATEREWPALRRRLMDPVGFVRSAAVRAFWELGRPEAARWIAPLLRDRDRRVVLAATQAYAALAGPAEGARLFAAAGGPGRGGTYLLGELIARARPPGWEERLTSWVASPDRYRRSIAADGLAAAPARDAGPLVLGLLDDPDPAVRLSALLALTKLDPPGIVERIAPLATAADESTRADVASFIHATRGPRWSRVAGALLGDPSPTVVRNALEAAATSFDPSQIALAEKLLQRPESAVRNDAAIFLGRRGGEAQLPALLALLDNEDTAVGAVYGLADLGDPKAIPKLREVFSGRMTFLRGDVARALAFLGSTQEAVELAGSGESLWWILRDRFLNLPAEATARIARLALGRRDDPDGSWSEEAILTLDGGRIAEWEARDRREFQRRMQNVATFGDEPLRMAATTRLLEWGLADDAAEQALLRFAFKVRGNERGWNAMCAAFAARHEPAYHRLASEPRLLEKDLVTCADVEAWAGSFGQALDMGGYSTLRTWRKGHRASLREILEETVEVSDRTIYVEGGKARIVLVQEGLEFWRKRLEGK